MLPLKTLPWQGSVCKNTKGYASPMPTAAEVFRRSKIFRVAAQGDPALVAGMSNWSWSGRVLWAAAVVWSASAARAESWTDERVWMSADGRELRGHLVEATSEGGVKLTTANGAVEVPVTRLSREDRAFVFRHAAQQLRRVTPPPVRPSELTPADRWLLPSLDQARYGSRDADCAPNAFANFVFWWHDLGVLSLREPTDRARMVNVAHTQLARWCKTSNREGTSLTALVQGARAYLAAEQTELALTGEARVFSGLAELQAAIRPDMAVVLGVELRRGSGVARRAHAASLVAVDANARTATLHTWGERLSGRWERVVLKGEPFLQFTLPEDPSRPPGGMEREGAFLLREDKIEAALLWLEPKPKTASPAPAAPPAAQ